MRIDCIKCGDRIDLGLEICPHCGANQLSAQKVSVKSSRSVFWWVKYVLLCLLELYFQLGIIGCVIQLFLLQSLGPVFLLLGLFLAILFPGLPAFFLGRYLIRSIKKHQAPLVEVTAELPTETTLYEPEEKLGFIGRMNRLSNRLWDRYPVTVVVVFIFILINGANTLFYQEANRLYRNPSVTSHGAAGFALGFITLYIFLSLFVIAHMVLFGGGTVGLVIDSGKYDKKKAQGQLKPARHSFNPVLPLLVVGLVPTLMVYSIMTRPLWWPILGPVIFQATASPTEKLQKDLSTGKTENILSYIRQGADVNARGGHHERTVLMEAVSLGDYELASEIIKAGADLNLVDKSGKTALDHVYTSKTSDLAPGYDLSQKASIQARIVKLLLEHKAKPYTVTEKRCHSALNTAVQNYDLELVSVLLEAGVPGDGFPQIPECYDSQTPLAQALSPHTISPEDKIGMMETLIGRGASINPKSVIPPIHAAVSSSKNPSSKGADEMKTLAAYLLEKGADINAVDRYGYTPIMKVTSNKEYRPVVDFLLECGAKVNTVASNGATTISTAAISGDLALVKLLEKKGAKIDPKGETGIVALSSGVASQNQEMLEYFIRQGVDVNTPMKPIYPGRKQKNSQSLIFMAVQGAENGKFESLNFLLGAGASPNDASGNSPALSEVIQNAKDKPEIALLLLEHGANPNTVSPDGVYAIWGAVLWDKIEVAEALLEKGANPNVFTNGKTPLDIAIDWEPTKPGFTALLKQYGAKTAKELSNS